MWLIKVSQAGQSNLPCVAQEAYMKAYITLDFTLLAFSPIECKHCMWFPLVLREVQNERSPESTPYRRVLISTLTAR
jgi:hypothetical protein